jgi:hypothetical protein
MRVVTRIWIFRERPPLFHASVFHVQRTHASPKTPSRRRNVEARQGAVTCNAGSSSRQHVHDAHHAKTRPASWGGSCTGAGQAIRRQAGARRAIQARMLGVTG